MLLYTLELPVSLHTFIFFFLVLWYNFHRLLFDDEKEKLYQQSGLKKNISSNTHGRGPNERRAALWPVLISTWKREQLASGAKRPLKKTWNSFSRSDFSEFFFPSRFVSWTPSVVAFQLSLARVSSLELSRRVRNGEGNAVRRVRVASKINIFVLLTFPPV